MALLKSIITKCLILTTDFARRARKCSLGRHLKSQHHMSNIHKWPAIVMS